MLHLGHKEVIGMGKKYRVDKKKVDRLETLEYSEMIKLAAVYKIGSIIFRVDGNFPTTLF